MADDNETRVVLDLDNSQFLEKMAESLGVMESLGVDGAASVAGLAEKLGMIVGIVGPIAVAILAVKAALDLTVESEHIEAVNKNFDMMAKSVGLAADEIKENLVKAAGGLAGETEIIQAGSKAIMQMGENAKHIPEIMELARKYTQSFGGDLVDNFSRMSSAMENGNVRMLRQFGLIVDATKAHQEFAQSIGTSTEFLSQAGQKQAIFNASLDQAREKFSNLDTSSLKVTTNLQKIGTAFTELKDGVAEVFGFIEKKLHIMETLTDQVALVVGFWGKAIKKAVTDSSDASEKHQENLKKEIALQEQSNATVNNDKFKDKEKILKEETKFQGEILKIKQAAEKDEEKSFTTLEQFKSLRKQEELTANQQAEQKIQELRVNALAKGLISEQQYATAVDNIHKKLNSDITQIRVKSENDEITALKNLAAQNDKTSTAFGAQWAKHGAEVRKNLASMSKASDVTFGAIQNHAVTAFKAMGDGSKSGADAMKGFVLGALGDIAMEYGTFHLINGIATYNFVEVAEGGALIALGAALSSMGSGSGSSASASSSSGGGGGGSSSAMVPSLASSSASPTPAAAQQKHMTVAINGNIFDTDQTRTRLVDMLRQASDATDFQFTKVGSTF